MLNGRADVELLLVFNWQRFPHACPFLCLALLQNASLTVKQCPVLVTARSDSTSPTCGPAYDVPVAGRNLFSNAQFSAQITVVETTALLTLSFPLSLQYFLLSSNTLRVSTHRTPVTASSHIHVLCKDITTCPLSPLPHSCPISPSTSAGFFSHTLFIGGGHFCETPLAHSTHFPLLTVLVPMSISGKVLSTSGPPSSSFIGFSSVFTCVRFLSSSF